MNINAPLGVMYMTSQFTSLGFLCSQRTRSIQPHILNLALFFPLLTSTLSQPPSVLCPTLGEDKQTVLSEARHTPAYTALKVL